MALIPLPSPTPIPKAAPVDPPRLIGLRVAGTAESVLRPLTATRTTCYPVAADGRRLPSVAGAGEPLEARYGSAMGLDLIVAVIHRGEDTHLGSHTLETTLAVDPCPPFGAYLRLQGEVKEEIVAVDGTVTLGGRTSSKLVDWS